MEKKFIISNYSDYKKGLISLYTFIKNESIVTSSDKKILLSSGGESSNYFDLRKITLSYYGSKLISRIILFLTQNIKYDTICGMTLGADPIVSSVVAISSRRIEGALIRKNKKTYGMQNTIEGSAVKGKNILIVDDVSTTGNSLLNSIQTIREKEGKVVAVITIINRGNRVFDILKIPYFFLFHSDNFS